MDLNELDVVKSADQGAEMEVRHPVTDDVLLDKDGNPVVMYVLGSDSSVLRNAMKERARKQLNARKSKLIDVDEAERVGSEMLAICITGWRGLSENGVEIQFSKSAAIDLFMRYTWLRSQVDAFINERENFFKA